MITATLRLKNNKTFSIVTDKSFNFDLLDLLESADNVVAYKLSVDGSELKQSSIHHFFGGYAAPAGKLVQTLFNNHNE